MLSQTDDTQDVENILSTMTLDKGVGICRDLVSLLSYKLERRGEIAAADYVNKVLLELFQHLVPIFLEGNTLDLAQSIARKLNIPLFGPLVNVR